MASIGNLLRTVSRTGVVNVVRPSVLGTNATYTNRFVVFHVMRLSLTYLSFADIIRIKIVDIEHSYPKTFIVLRVYISNDIT